MKVEYLGVNGLSSDIGICDAARVSFDKRAENYDEKQNAKLLSYLFHHKHWSPYGHAREAFLIHMPDEAWLEFLLKVNPAGFSFSRRRVSNSKVISGSLWAWYENMCFLPAAAEASVLFALRSKYKLVPFWKEECFYPALVLEKHNSLAVHESLFELMSTPPLRSAEDISVSFRIQAPVFVARQLVKHQVGLCWNEESRRYIDSEPTFWEPGEWRAKPKDKKQGSTGLVKNQAMIQDEFLAAQGTAIEAYMTMVQEEVAPEMARAVLPLSMNTSWVWTGTLDAFARVARERLALDAQAETRQVVAQMDHFLKNDPMTKEYYAP